MNFDPKKIGMAMRYIRQKKNLRQEDVAYKVDISAAYVGLIENGKRIPSLAMYARLAEAMDAEVDLFMHEKGEPVQSELLVQYGERIDNLKEEQKKQLFTMIDIYLKSCEN